MPGQARLDPGIRRKCTMIEREGQKIIGTVFFDETGDPVMRWRLYRGLEACLQGGGTL
jgi:hypothetical protein